MGERSPHGSGRGRRRVSLFLNWRSLIKWTIISIPIHSRQKQENDVSIIRQSIFVPFLLNNLIRHLSMNKSTSVGFNTILQGAEEESVHWVIGRHTLVPAVEQELMK